MYGVSVAGSLGMKVGVSAAGFLGIVHIGDFQTTNTFWNNFQDSLVFGFLS